jgi:hypothetical protein
MPQHYSKCYTSYNRFNRPNGIIIKDTTWTAQQISDTFCKGNTPEARAKLRDETLSTPLANGLKQGEFYKEFTIIRAVFLANDEMWNGGSFQRPVKDAVWIGVEFEFGEPKDKNKPLRTSPYYSQPFVVWDYNKKLQEAVSRTPADDAIWDVRSHQDVFKDFLENSKLQNRPPVVALSGMRGRMDLSADGFTFVDEQEYQTPPKKVDVVGNLVFNKELADLFAEALKRHFHIDEFQRFNSLAQSNKQPVSALQIMQMSGENSVLLGPALESQDRDLTDTDARFMQIEIEAGRGPFAPDIMANIQDVIEQNIKNHALASVSILPEFISQLSRAQKIQQALDPIREAMEAGQYVSSIVDPDLMHLMVRGYETLDEVFQAVGFSPKNYNTKKDYQEAADHLAQMRQQAAQQAQQMEMMQNAKNVTGPIDKSSILAGMNGAAA